VLTKSRRRLTKLSGGAGGLGDRVVKDDGDTCRESGGGVADTLLWAVWWFGSQNHWWTVLGFGPQNPGAVLAGIGGGMWCHCDACVMAKLSHEGRMDIRLADLRVRP
jgi:hypothetical protein